MGRGYRREGTMVFMGGRLKELLGERDEPADEDKRDGSSAEE